MIRIPSSEPFIMFINIRVLRLRSTDWKSSLTFSLATMKFCNSVLRATAAVPTQTFFRLRINTFLTRKILLLFHQKTALCYMFIFFHVSLNNRIQIKLRSDAFLKFLFKNPFEAGNQFNADVLSQSASSNHALLITKSALVISICNRMGPRAIKD